MWAVLIRELRADCRRWTHFASRAAAATVCVAFLVMSLGSADVSSVCRLLFPVLHTCLLGVLLIAGPLPLVESLGRERRRGTLQLLWLTPLGIPSMVHAITLAASLRVAVFLGCAAPVLMLTVLFGGIGAPELLLSGMMQATALLIALASGLTAGVMARNSARGVALALLLSLTLAAGSAAAWYAWFLPAVAAAYPKVWPPTQGLLDWVAGAWSLASDGGAIWGRLFGVVSAAQGAAWLQRTSWGPAGAGFLLLATTLLCRYSLRAALLRNQYRGPEAETVRPFWLQLTGPVPAAKRRRWLRGNPVEWLKKRSPEARLFRWVGAGVLVICQVAGRRVFPSPDAWWLGELTLGLLIALLLALVAAGSYREDREEGGMELLLVSPIRTRHLIAGQLRALAWMFAPALIAWALSAAFDGRETEGRSLALVLWVCGSCAAIPGIGLEASFNFRSFWTAAGVTVGLGVGVGGLLFWGAMISSGEPWIALLALAPSAFFAALALPGVRLRFRMRRNGENPSENLRSPRNPGLHHRFRRPSPSLEAPGRLPA